MGQQISALFYLGGFDVHVWNKSGVNEKSFQRQVKLLRRAIPSVNEGTFTTCSDLSGLSDSITIESVIEDLSIKKEIYEFRKDNNSPYFTNSSSYSPNEIGGEVNGFHFFNPISLRLVELYVNEATKRIIHPLISYLEEIGFTIVDVNDNRGYIGNYILFHEISSALKLIEKFDYEASSINSVYNKLYGGRNIFTIVDIIGVDVVHSILVNLKEHDSSIYIPTSLQLALDKDILGKKNKTSIMDIL